MGETTGITWTDHTFNAWEGCTKVSPGCRNCYAETRNERFHGGKHWGAEAPRLMRSPAYWREPFKWAKAARAAGVRRRVFCASLADVFEDRADVLDARARLFAVIEGTPELDWLLLTKRPENMVRLAPSSWADGWPDHVWAGTTAENNATLKQRVPHLKRVPAVVRFLSCEPLLEALDLDPPYCDSCEDFVAPEWVISNEGFEAPTCPEHHDELSFSACLDPCADREQRGINWVIVGGESGTNARLFDLGWALQIVRQCKDAGVPVFVKQLGSKPVRMFSSKPKPQFLSCALRDRAGADPAEWPEDLRVQQFPGGAR